MNFGDSLGPLPIENPQTNADTLLPGRGFFKLAREHLGAYPTDATDDEVFIRETRRVYEHYGRRPK